MLNLGILVELVSPIYFHFDHLVSACKLKLSVFCLNVDMYGCACGCSCFHWLKHTQVQACSQFNRPSILSISPVSLHLRVGSLMLKSLPPAFFLIQGIISDGSSCHLIFPVLSTPVGLISPSVCPFISRGEGRNGESARRQPDDRGEGGKYKKIIFLSFAHIPLSVLLLFPHAILDLMLRSTPNVPRS